MRSVLSTAFTVSTFLLTLYVSVLPVTAQQKPDNACSETLCPAGTACYEGACFPTDIAEPTPEDACADVVCPVNHICYEGGCFPDVSPADVSVLCPEGSVESDASCKPASLAGNDPCEDVICPIGMVCYEGGCFAQALTDTPAEDQICEDLTCPEDFVCYQGGCFPDTTPSDDACTNVTCPATMACYQGGCFESLITEATMPPLTYTGRSQNFTMPLLSYIGTKPAIPLSFTMPELSYAGRTLQETPQGRPTNAMEIVPLPKGSRQSTYLSIEDATFARDETLRITYSGLPAKSGTLSLFYLGESKPIRTAWFYTRADKSEGVFEREGTSLPSLTGPWKACIGFAPDISVNVNAPETYADCIDFILVGQNTRTATPSLALSTPEPRAGRAFTVNWSDFPPVNASIALVYLDTDKLIARTLTSSHPVGTWDVTIDQAGRYEFQIFLEGNALRARMPLEVIK